MFKNCFNWIALIILSLSFFACSKQKDSSGKTLSSDETEIIENYKGSLNKGYSLVSYQIIEGNLPYQLWIDLSLENSWIFKERLDYLSSLKSESSYRDKYIADNIKDFQRYQDYILAEIEKAQDDPKTKRNFKIILANIEYDDGLEMQKFKKIVAYNPETREKVLSENIPYTATLLSVLASRNEIVKYGTRVDEPFNVDSLAQTVSDPVLKFILEPVKETTNK